MTIHSSVKCRMQKSRTMEHTRPWSSLSQRSGNSASSSGRHLHLTSLSMSHLRRNNYTEFNQAICSYRCEKIQMPIGRMPRGLYGRAWLIFSNTGLLWLDLNDLTWPNQPKRQQVPNLNYLPGKTLTLLRARGCSLPFYPPSLYRARISRRNRWSQLRIHSLVQTRLPSL